jgi:hypothetical protein
MRYVAQYKQRARASVAWRLETCLYASKDYAQIRDLLWHFPLAFAPFYKTRLEALMSSREPVELLLCLSQDDTEQWHLVYAFPLGDTEATRHMLHAKCV